MTVVAKGESWPAGLVDLSNTRLAFVLVPLSAVTIDYDYLC